MARGKSGQKIVRPPSKHYGEGEKLAEAQRQMPVAEAPGLPPAAPAGAPAPVGPPMPPVPAGGLYDPSGRPNEPVHAGMMGGPGPGPDFGFDDQALLEAIAQKYPSPGIYRMLERFRAQG